jgi:hypothetical protein
MLFLFIKRESLFDRPSLPPHIISTAEDPEAFYQEKKVDIKRLQGESRIRKDKGGNRHRSVPRKSSAVREKVKAAFGQLLSRTAIRKNTMLNEAVRRGVSILEHDPR